jgi:hypothetical protein
MSRSSKWSLLFRLSNQNILCISCISHVCHMRRPSNSSWFDHPNNIWWNVQVMKLLIMQSSAASRHLLPLRAKCIPGHPVPRHPQCVLPLVQT